MEMEKHFSQLSLETLEQTREGQNALPPRTTLGGIWSLAKTYNVFRKIPTGEFLLVAARRNQEEANRLAQTLNEQWPGEYAIRESAEPDEVVTEGSKSPDNPAD